MLRVPKPRVLYIYIYTFLEPICTFINKKHWYLNIYHLNCSSVFSDSITAEAKQINKSTGFSGTATVKHFKKHVVLTDIFTLQHFFLLSPHLIQNMARCQNVPKRQVQVNTFKKRETHAFYLHKKDPTS